MSNSLGDLVKLICIISLFAIAGLHFIGILPLEKTLELLLLRTIPLEVNLLIWFGAPAVVVIVILGLIRGRK